MKAGRKPAIGRVILMSAAFNRTVAEIVRATGARPETVRKVLIRAEDRGEIVLRRFVRGRCGRTIFVERHTAVDY